jgi:hypothetical protein
LRPPVAQATRPASAAQKRCAKVSNSLITPPWRSARGLRPTPGPRAQATAFSSGFRRRLRDHGRFLRPLKQLDR